MTGANGVFAFSEIGYDYGMGKTLRGRQLRDAYRFTGFFPAAIVRGAFGDPLVRVLTLRRRQKNSLWDLWAGAPRFLRSEALSGSRLVVWGAPHLFGGARAPGRLPELRQGETRRTGLVGR